MIYYSHPSGYDPKRVSLLLILVYFFMPMTSIKCESFSKIVCFHMIEYFRYYCTIANKTTDFRNITVTCIISLLNFKSLFLALISKH